MKNLRGLYWLKDKKRVAKNSSVLSESVQKGRVKPKSRPAHEHTFVVVVVVVVVENITFITVPISGRIHAAPCPGCRVGRTRISHFTFSLLILET